MRHAAIQSLQAVTHSTGHYTATHRAVSTIGNEHERVGTNPKIDRSSATLNMARETTICYSSAVCEELASTSLYQLTLWLVQDFETGLFCSCFTL